MQQNIRINGIHVDLHVPCSTGIQWVYMFLADMFFFREISWNSRIGDVLFAGRTQRFWRFQLDVCVLLGDSRTDRNSKWVICECLLASVFLTIFGVPCYMGTSTLKIDRYCFFCDVGLFQVIMANPDIHLAVVIFLD